MRRRAPLRRLLALAILLVLVAAACGGGDDGGGGDGDAFGGGGDTDTQDTAGTDEPDELTPQPGGTLSMGLTAESDGLAPWTSAFSAAGHAMAVAVFDTIAVFDENGEAVPFLAESWSVDDECLTWTVKLRDGIMFHDGTPLTADAVRVTVEAQLNDPLVGNAVKPYHDNEEPITVIDDLTYTVNLTIPDCNASAFWTGQLGYVASPTWVEASAENPDLLQRPVGTGPFVFEDRVQDSRTSFVRNENWWNGTPYLDRVEFVIQPDGARRADTLLAGDTNMLQTTSVPNIERVKNTDASIQHLEDITGAESFVMINTTAPPFDDVEVRRILTLATPIDAYVQSFGTEKADSMFHPSLKWNNPDVVQEGDQFEEAATAAAAWCADHADMCDGDKINMSFTRTAPSVENDQIEAVLRSGWENAFNVSSDQVLEDDYIALVALGNYNVVTWRQFENPEPGRDRVWLGCENIGGISLNWPRNCNETTQAALDAQAATTDEAERIAAWQTIQEQVNQDYLYVFLTHTLWDVMSAENVHGQLDAVTPEGVPIAPYTWNGYVRYENIWLD